MQSTCRRSGCHALRQNAAENSNANSSTTSDSNRVSPHLRSSAFISGLETASQFLHRAEIHESLCGFPSRLRVRPPVRKAHTLQCCRGRGTKGRTRAGKPELRNLSFAAAVGRLQGCREEMPRCIFSRASGIPRLHLQIAGHKKRGLQNAAPFGIHDCRPQSTTDVIHHCPE